MKQNQFDLRKVKVHRTTEGTIFEIVTAVLLIVLWVVTFVTWKNSGPTVATHFDFAGRPNGYGSRGNLLLTAAIGTLVPALLLACAYRPQWVSLPVKIRNIRQTASAIRMVRMLAVIIVLLFISIPLSTALGIIFPGSIFGIGIILIVAFYTYKIYRQK